MGELAPTLRRLAEAERRYAEELHKLAESIRYMVPLAALLEAVALDSEKHARIYEALFKIATGASQPGLVEEDLRLLEGVIERHIETEARMIEEARGLLDSVGEARLKLLLASILEDELRHHRLLTDVRDKVAKRRVLTDAEFWDAVWRDSPWHGAPGG